MINDSDPKKLIKSLCDEINRHNKLYYVDAKPQISDKDFDNLLTKLEALENKFPQFKSESSPTQRVGGKPLDDLIVLSIQFLCKVFQIPIIKTS